MTRQSIEESATERVREAGWEPDEPFPGKAAAPWRLKCQTCGHIVRRLSTPSQVKPCHHPKQAEERERERRIAEAMRLLMRFDLRGLEPFPGKGAPMWAQCSTCKRPLRLPDAGAPFFCRHQNVDGQAEAPEFSPEGMERLHFDPQQSYIAWLDQDDAGLVMVEVCNSEITWRRPHRGMSYFQLPVDASGMPPQEGALRLLAELGWEPGDAATWDPDDGGHRIPVTTSEMSLYEITNKELIPTRALDREKAAEMKLGRLGVGEVGYYKRPTENRKWFIYERGRVLGALAAERIRVLEGEAQQE